MEIRPVYVTFEQAKLLKEKDYPQKSCDNGYTLDGQDSFDYTIDWLNKKAIVKPEQWQVVEWLRVNHNLWVNVNPCMNVKSDWITLIKNTFSFKFSVTYATEKLYIEHYKKPVIFKKGFNSPQEAYSAALDYILKELI